MNLLVIGATGGTGRELVRQALPQRHRVTVFVVLAFIASITSTLEAQILPDSSTIPANTFPFVVGRQFVYSGYLRDAAADTNITTTGSSYRSKWTIVSTNAPFPFPGLAGTGHYIADTTITSAVTLILPQFFKSSNQTDSSDIMMVLNIGRFYRIFGINRSDSMRLMLVVRFGEFLGYDWTAFDSTFSTTIGPARLRYTGRCSGREMISLPLGTFDAYKIELTQTIFLGGSSTPVVISPALKLWLAQAFGPVKMIIHADGERYGHFRELSASNFGVTKAGAFELPPTSFFVFQNYPNPFNSGTTIAYTLSERTDVRLVVFNLLGEEIVALDLGERPAGNNSFWLDAGKWPTGTYIYRLQSQSEVAAKKLLIIK